MAGGAVLQPLAKRPRLRCLEPALYRTRPFLIERRGVVSNEQCAAFLYAAFEFRDILMIQRNIDERPGECKGCKCPFCEHNTACEPAFFPGMVAAWGLELAKCDRTAYPLVQ